MRAISSPQAAILATGSYSVAARVRVKDGGGTWRDLSDYGGVDWIESIARNESVNDPLASADIVLKREVHQLSLAPLMQSSALNRGFSPAAPYVSLLAKGRELKVDTAICLRGERAPPDGVWLNVFHGRVDEVDPAAGETVTLACRDLGGLLMDTYIEQERVYSFDAAGAAIKGLRIWEPNTAYALNDLALPAGKLNDRYYKTTTAGTSDATEPVWPTTIGATVTSGTAVFTCEAATSSTGKPVEVVIQSILNDWPAFAGVAAPVLYTPVTPGWNIKEYKQGRVPVMDALQELARQIGWDVRYRWRESTAQFELTFWSPDRAKTTPDRTITASQYLTVERLSESLDNIRTTVAVIYSDSADTDASGTSKRKKVTATDAALEASLGRRYFEWAEDDASNIDTATEAQRLADNVLADVSQADAEMRVTDLYLPTAELGDLYEFAADPLLFDSPQSKAVVAIADSFSASSDRTTLTLAGKPTLGKERILIHEARPGVRPNHDAALFNNAPALVTIDPTVGGGMIRVTATKQKNTKWTGNEIHISTVSDFTPTAATLQARSVGEDYAVADLEPGVTYFVKTVPYGWNDTRIVRGQPTPQTSFVAGYLEGKDVFPYLDFRSYPLNGHFESPGANNAPPDVWRTVTGAFGTDWTLHNIDGAYSGTMKAEFLGTAVATEILSGWVPVREGNSYVLTWALLKLGVPGVGATVSATVIWYDFEQTSIGATSQTVDLPSLASGWQMKTLLATAPVAATWARVLLSKNADATARAYLDGVELAAHGGASGSASSSASILNASCSATDAIGDLVRLTSATAAARANPSAVATMPAVGVIIAKSGDTSCTVQLTGIVEGIFSGLTPGARYFVGSDGRPVRGRPTSGVAQRIGVATSATRLLLSIDSTLVVLR